MRIIGGVHRSRRILGPEDERTTRPIIDRVKQSLFDRLWAIGAVGEESGGRNVLDIFSGTGSLGLEALSRGAEHCTFIEKDRSARQRLERNLADLQLSGQATVMSVDALSGVWLNMAHLAGARTYHLIFVDPPYRLVKEEATKPRVLALMAAVTRIAAAEAVMVLRTPEDVTVPPLEQWRGPESHIYGSMALHLFTLAGHSG